ncbi:MAG: SH3 domain-containing protein [Clostridiales bacterium]|nr:SH3 domain-containing protein [Clostridiales bacterium]
MKKAMNPQKRYLALLAALCFAVPLFSPLSAPAEPAPVGYMPGVTEEMTNPAFWSDLTGNPDALLATAEDIARINAAAEAGNGTNRRDMKNLKETYDGIAKNEALQKSTQSDAEYYLGWVWDQNGHKMTQEDFDVIKANCVDPNAAEEMPVRWGIAVNRTELITFPWDGQILDDPVDFDFDYQPLVGIRVNEPVAVYSTSADGKFYQVSTSCCTGWVRMEDIAICRDKEEWLSAWDIPAEKRLVFWGDKMYTDYSKTAAETTCRLITMGTVLERMDEADPDALVINRLPLHNYAVYLPIRNEDGSYGKTPALINARERVSEDYLPLTARNLAMVALASLGDAYGWGAGLNNEDCTSLDHSIFCCFGLDLPRNGTWQWLMDFPKADITYYTLEEREALLDALPMGTLLNFPGHQMMYLGKYAGNYYVVSTVSSIMSPYSGKRQRTRDVQINTTDIKRANGKTWIQALNKVYVPWLYLNEGEEAALSELPAYHEDTAYCLEKGLMDAWPSGYFLPLRGATVAEGVQMLWRIAGKPEPDMSQEGFTDVAGGSENEKAALWAKQTGVYAGMEGKFQAGASLTWEAIRAMAESLVREDVIGEHADAAMTRAELAGIAKPVSEAWAARHPEMPSDPFGTASANSPYYAKPCNERLASLPEALMKLAEGGYSWEYEYVADKPAYALTLMDYANIYSFIHTHDLDPDTLCGILSDADLMVHRKAFTEEEIDLLLGDDQAAAMAHFASPSTIVMGEKGYSEKWMYDHTIEEWEAEGITPEMVIFVQENYYNPLFTQKAAKAFSQKLYYFTGVLTPVRLGQWNPGEVRPDGSVAEDGENTGVMLDVIEFCQYPDYPTGCESVSLYMLLNYYGLDVTVDQIYDLLPMGAQPYDDEAGVRHGANPEREFVGDPRSEYSYGVFNEPIAQVAEQFMPGAATKAGAAIDEIKAILDTGNPVLAWYVSAPMRDIMYRWSWLDENGETVHWPGGEHAVVICGYDENSITYRDPNAGTTVVIDTDTFLKSFNELGGRIVYYTVQH